MKKQFEQNQSRPELSRRDFVRTVRDSTLLLVLPQFLGCRAQAPSVGETSYTLKFLLVSEAETVEAITARIFPSDEQPGAPEALVVHFIDHMLATHYRDQQNLYRGGLSKLDRLSIERFSRRFHNVRVSEQDLLLSEIEQGLNGEESRMFFTAIRAHTIQGMFSDPKYFGNRDRVGWQILDI